MFCVSWDSLNNLCTLYCVFCTRQDCGGFSYLILFVILRVTSHISVTWQRVWWRETTRDCLELVGSPRPYLFPWQSNACRTWRIRGNEARAISRNLQECRALDYRWEKPRLLSAQRQSDVLADDATAKLASDNCPEEQITDFVHRELKLANTNYWYKRAVVFASTNGDGMRMSEIATQTFTRIVLLFMSTTTIQTHRAMFTF